MAATETRDPRPGITIGEAAARRHTAPIASMTLWAGLCGSAVIALHALGADLPSRLGSYRSGIITVAIFLLAVIYPLRKYTIWFSVRWLRLASRLPRPVGLRMLLFDRLETWRVAHITLGVFAMLPFWWHTQVGRATALEVILKTLVLLLILSGLLGAIIEDFLPARMLTLGNKEVRLEDVEAGYHQLYVEAEELVLGHSESLVHGYLLALRPILLGNQPLLMMLWATLSGSDPARGACAPARMLAEGFGAESGIFHQLVSIAERKVRLEHNQFNLRMGMSWLRVHRLLAVAVFVLIAFHIAGALYFSGI